MLVEKYRPKSFDELIGQEHVKKVVIQHIKRYKSGEIDSMPHFLFTGPPGTGKTTTAQIIARELYGDNWKLHYLELNASSERGIEVIRSEVKYASKQRIGKIIFLDEADSLTLDAQHALRRIMETTAKNCFFILACNDINGIIEPIIDRCVVLYFNKLTHDEIIEVIFRVLDKEGVEYNADEKLLSALELLIDYADGSARRALNQLEKMIVIRNGKKVLTPDTVIQNVPEDISEKILEMINKDQMDSAIKLLEDLYIQNRFDPSFTIKRLYKVLRKIDDKLMRAVAYRELAKLEETVLKYNCNPLIQFSRFIATLWIAKYQRNVKVI